MRRCEMARCACRWTARARLLPPPPPPATAAAEHCSPPPVAACPQESRLTIVDLAVGHSGDEIASHPAMKRLASFTHSGRVAAVEVRGLRRRSGCVIRQSAVVAGLPFGLQTCQHTM